MLQVNGEPIISPAAKQGMIPLTIPLSRNRSGFVTALLRWPTAPPGMEMPVVEVRKHGVWLLAKNVDQYIHRILVEEDANISQKRNDELFHAAADAGTKLYKKGDFAESQISSLDVYLLRKVQLDALGLKIIQVTADGNCFFRTLVDQLEGNEDEHMKYRIMAVDFIRKNREMYEPFIEDEVPFDEYCQSMEKDGTWAGHMEIQAASLVTHTNICIHQKMSPSWYIQNFDNHEAQMIHLSYHDEEHYNSVRLKEDTCSGAARPVTIKADADISTQSHQVKVSVTKSKGNADKNIIQAGSIKMVVVGSGCENYRKAEQVLLQLDGDVDAAIEFLIAEQGSEESVVENDNFAFSAGVSHGENQNDNPEPHKAEVDDNMEKGGQSCDNIGRTRDNNILQQFEKITPSRNKTCPCGSKKKYKSCCGSVAGRSSAKFAINQTVDCGKGRKDKKHGKKSGANNVVNSHVSEGGPPDVGALCI